MMNIIYEGNFKFVAKVDCSGVKIDEEEYNVLVLIKEFVKEFLKHPKAAEIYYKNYFIDTFLNENGESKVIKERLGYENDFKDLFIGIAESCSPDVEQFLKYSYGDDEEKNPDNESKPAKAINIERVREILDKQFGALKVLTAEFKEIEKEEEKEKEKEEKDVICQLSLVNGEIQMTNQPANQPTREPIPTNDQ